MKYFKIIVILALFSTTVACNKELDALLENPNSPSLNTADVDYLLNQVQTSFSGFFDDASNLGGQLTRQQAMFGPLYSNAYSPGTSDGLWTSGYTSIIKNANALIPLAQKQNKFRASGMAKFFKAYTLATMVDAFGDIPWTEAELGMENYNPKADKGAAVYAAAIAILDDAIVDFQKTGGLDVLNDLYYGNSSTRWITAAKTMKFKLLMQTRKVDPSAAAKIQALVTAGDLIKTATGDFNFKYGSNRTSPDSRHPDYASNYNASGAVGEYLGDWFMWAVVAEKNGGNLSGLKGKSLDPRQRYYFYRQNTTDANVTSITLSCIDFPRPAHYSDNQPFCLIGSGYWGRDHGDNSGTPPDGSYRTTWGIYPAGGLFDENQGKKVALEVGGKGAGILPIWNSEFTHFKLAEAAATGVITGGMAAARASLKTAISNNLAKVTSFPATLNVNVDTTYAANSATISKYVDLVLNSFDAAKSDDAKLEIIMKEFYLSTWGNGWEAYNAYRLTGYPKNMQPTVYSANPGFFIRSFYYPSVYVNRNLNAPAQKALGVKAEKVFWDNNADNFIN
jgi:hypothetical protein